MSVLRGKTMTVGKEERHDHGHSHKMVLMLENA